MLDVEAEKGRWDVAVVYASPSSQLRNILWDNLKAEALDLNEAWMAVGDFNAVSSVDEVSNSNTFSTRRCSGMNSWMFDEHLIDLGYVGGKFTWMRGKEAATFKAARLDRAVGTMNLLELFPDAQV